MRRKDREITDREKIKSIILACHCCRLGFCDNGKVYIVPLNFGYDETADKRTFYFHGAKEGRKIDLILKNGYAGFELDTNYLLREGDIACEYTARFQSVIGEGRVSFIEEPKEKKEALLHIMKHHSDKGEWEFSDEMLHAVSLFKLEVEEISCKEHR